MATSKATKGAVLSVTVTKPPLSTPLLADASQRHTPFLCQASPKYRMAMPRSLAYSQVRFHFMHVRLGGVVFRQLRDEYASADVAEHRRPIHICAEEVDRVQARTARQRCHICHTCVAEIESVQAAATRQCKHVQHTCVAESERLQTEARREALEDSRLQAGAAPYHRQVFLLYIVTAHIVMAYIVMTDTVTAYM